MDLVPIKVKIGLRSNGHADHPDWSKLPLARSVIPSTLMFHGWKYDKTSGHAESTPDSPIGVQYGVVLVTPEFAVQALSVFPDIIEVLTENQLETFWNEKAYGHVTEDRVDVSALQALLVERQLREAIGSSTTEVDTRIVQSLDPTNRRPGKRSNPMKWWKDAKKTLDVTVVQLP